jgi:hypothetical protein
VYTLRRVLYLQAALFALVGTALAIAPTILLPHLFGQPVALSRETAWVRLAGIEAVGLSMLMVMVGHRVEELWWWVWAFAFTTLALTAVVVLNAAFGLDAGENLVAWWLFAGVMVTLTAALLYALFVSSREQPLP